MHSSLRVIGLTVLLAASGARAGSEATGAQIPPSEAVTKTGNERPALSIGLRAHLRYVADESDPFHQFEVRRARLFVDVTPTDWLSGQLDLDVSRAAPLHDAWVQITVAPWLKLKVGQFKKPFSRLELTSSRVLPLWERGIVNDRIIEDNNFEHGGRDIGLMARGKAGSLRYFVGVFNGNGKVFESDSGKDFALRLTYRPFKALRLGASGSLKLVNIPGVAYSRNHFLAAGVDARIRYGLVDIVAEALWAEKTLARRVPSSVGGTLYTVLRFPLDDLLQLRPVFKVELLDDDVSRSKDLTWAFLAGVNLHIGEVLRLMTQVEKRMPEHKASVLDEWRFILQLAIDMEVDVVIQRIKEG